MKWWWWNKKKKIEYEWNKWFYDLSIYEIEIFIKHITNDTIMMNGKIKKEYNDRLNELKQKERKEKLKRINERSLC
jgi:hypothetical protein